MPLNILITGAGGLVGSALQKTLEKDDVVVHALSRHDARAPFYWDQENARLTLSDQIPLDAVVNLAGVNIGDQRWNASFKQKIRASRLQLTHALSEGLAKMDRPPKRFISASAIGYYGNTDGKVVTEAAPAGDGFLARLSVDWEAATEAAQKVGISVAHIRTSMVLSTRDGALAKMLTPFRLGLGGPIGNGQQLTSWISIIDEVRAIRFLLEHLDLTGAFNLAAPNPVSNRALVKAVAMAVKRPAVIPMPAFMARAAFGEMADHTLLADIGVTPERLIKSGFTFTYPQIDQALAVLLDKSL